MHHLQSSIITNGEKKGYRNVETVDTVPHLRQTWDWIEFFFYFYFYFPSINLSNEATLLINACNNTLARFSCNRITISAYIAAYIHRRQETP